MRYLSALVSGLLCTATACWAPARAQAPGAAYGPIYTSLDSALAAPQGSVQRLHLSAAGLDSLPARLLGLAPSLRFLVLSHNRLDSLPAWMGRLRALEVLAVNGNRLRALPASLAQLTALRQLDAAHNRLAELPAGLGALPRLERLSLAANPLTHIPQDLAGAPALRELDLSGLAVADYEQLGDVLIHQPHLRVLHLRGYLPPGAPRPVGAAYVPRQLARMDSLEALHLDGAPLDNPAADFLVLGRAPRLRLLSMAGTGLRLVPSNMGGYKRLEELRLDRNGLYMLPPELRKLRALRRLSLTGNAFHESEQARVRLLLPQAEVAF